MALIDFAEAPRTAHAGHVYVRPPRPIHLHQCLSLGLWWTVVPSAVGPSLRLSRDPEGKQLLLTPQEDCARLEEQIREERLARSIAEHERQLIRHEQSLAEQRACDEAAARQKSELERDALAAEVKRLRAELGRRT